MQFDQADFGQRLREIRKRNGLTQEQMSEELNISTDQLKKLEYGSRGPSIDLLISIAVWSGVSTDWLLLGYDYMILHSRGRLENILKELSGILAELPQQADRQQIPQSPPVSETDAGSLHGRL